MKINLEEIYSDFILEENVKNREVYKTKYKGWFSASSAGSCFRKQLYRANSYEAPESASDNRVGRLLRLGTIVHSDFEKAIENYKKNIDDDKVIYTEHRVELPELNVVGHLDIAVSDNDDSLEIYDIKTVASYKWSKQFGLIKNRDKNPSVKYELQLATYAIGMANNLQSDLDKIFLYLLWYKKDDSRIKIKEVPTFWMDNAFEYWTDLMDVQESVNDTPDKLIPGSENVPVDNWECRYCEYQGLYCEGVPSNRK